MTNDKFTPKKGRKQEMKLGEHVLLEKSLSLDDSSFYHV